MAFITKPKPVSATITAGFPAQFLKISGVIYLILMTDVLFFVTTLPVSAIIVFTQFNQSWLALAIVFPLVPIATGAAFHTFNAHVTEGSTAVVKDYLTGWVRSLKRVGPVGVVYTWLLVVCGVDFFAFGSMSLGAIGLPLLGVLAIIATAAMFVASAALMEYPNLGRFAAAKLGLGLGVRHGLWSLASLAMIAIYVVMIFKSPALALLLAPAPVTFFVWFNCRRILEHWDA
jgi:hypothetical protein